MAGEATIGLESQTPLTRAAKRLASAQGMDEIVAVLRSEARQVAGSDGIAVILREGDLCHYVAEDAIEPLWKGRRFPLDQCVSGWAILHRASAVIPDLEADLRVPREAYTNTSMRSLAMAPIGLPEPLGALGAYWCAYMDLDDATIRRLEILAEVAGAAMRRILGTVDRDGEAAGQGRVTGPALTADA
ncbi:GAF domain-containing protein [Methylobacterium aerolatum]|uniref:GAF domain-containing protein n=1 Tax=Methylobacterium aerolatum TaxID=418708 RepID=A0ABU0HX89_9HYPH|nr:GAF domain-containing protein [Methylobacterium aerolatum]MDQ0446962.1 GAF domain-containing protein [Methylobacterium aerolatum]GJD37019.1 hypothetical protein FMGBMHLM_3945 [Methylobacterium aerolatum]